MKKRITKAEIILYIILILITTLLLIWYFYVPSKGNFVEIRVSGKIIGTYSLKEDRNLTIEEQKGHQNILVIQNGTARVIEANCPDKICVNKGKVSRVGESIICLPHQVVIEIKADGNESEEGGVDVIAK